ncbi:DUF7563 family protein [Halomontanus rarus]|uniref:DUF7563 family protein n=1 Tax=Halomontanus rarus TaxID=3034020 RepID=UPI0023E8474D|nr:hypothetical protein [Halovivax sp. TS33]
MSVELFTHSTDENCLHCGAYVTDRFGRVFGDENNQVHRCSECDSYRRLSRGSAAGVDVKVPDPETSPGHHGSEVER